MLYLNPSSTRVSAIHHTFIKSSFPSSPRQTWASWGQERLRGSSKGWSPAPFWPLTSIPSSTAQPFRAGWGRGFGTLASQGDHRFPYTCKKSDQYREVLATLYPASHSGNILENSSISLHQAIDMKKTKKSMN